LSADEATERDSTDLESAPLVTNHAIDRLGSAGHLWRRLQLEAPCQEPGAARVDQDGAGLGGLEQCIESAPGRAAIRGIHAPATPPDSAIRHRETWMAIRAVSC